MKKHLGGEHCDDADATEVTDDIKTEAGVKSQFLLNNVMIVTTNCQLKVN